MTRKIKIGYIALAGSVTWLALGLQFYFYLKWSIRHQLGIAYGVWNYLSYFTQLSNLLAGITFLYVLINTPDSKTLSRNAKHITGVAVFLSMTSIIFNVELQHLSRATGLSHVADILLHDVSPLLFVVFWGLYIPHGQLRIKDALSWLAFPVLYFVYTLIRGYFIGHYPYPFLDAAKFGYESVVVNGFEMLAGFLCLGLFFVAMDKLKLKMTESSQDDIPALSA